LGALASATGACATLRDSRVCKPRKVAFGARATRKRIGSFVFARIKLVFARNGFYTRIDLYELVIITLARSSHSYWLARIGSDRSYRAHIGRIALVSYTLVSARIGRIGRVGSY
jgi:hypothetical protein